MTMVRDDARAGLAAKGEAERALAAAMTCPPWRHAVFGLVMGALVASTVVAMPLRLALIVLIFAAIILIVRSDRRRTGMFVNGYRRGKTLVVSLALLVIELGLYLFSIRAADDGQVALPLLLAGVAFVVSTIASIIWQRVFVRELGA